MAIFRWPQIPVCRWGKDVAKVGISKVPTNQTECLFFSHGHLTVLLYVGLACNKAAIIITYQGL